MEKSSNMDSVIRECIPKELEEIVELTPDSQNFDNLDDENYYNFYDKVALVNGTDNTRMARFIECADLIDCTGFLFDYFKENPDKREFGNIRSTVNTLYSDFDEKTREDIIANLKLRVSKNSLTSISEVQSKHDKNTLYHGTGSAALKGIDTHGALLSEYNILDLGEKLFTGEQDMERQPWKSSLVSCSEYESNGVHHALRDGIGDFEDFPVVFTFDKNKINKLGEFEDIYGFHFDREGGEVCIKKMLPLTCATDIYAPFSKMQEVSDFARKNDLNLKPIETLSYTQEFDFPEENRNKYLDMLKD